MEACCAHPVLWLGGSDGQFLVAAQVMWQSSNSELWVYSLLRPSDRPRAFSQKGSSYPCSITGLCSKNPKELFCDSPIGARHSRQRPHPPLALQVPLDLLDHMIQKQPAHQPGPSQSLVLLWAPLKTSIILCKLLCIRWIDNKVLLYSTGKCIQHPVINHNGKEYEKEKNTHIHMCTCRHFITPG